MINKKLARIYLVRHAESYHNAYHDLHDEKFHTQWGDSEAPLTKIGEKQAHKRAQELSNIKFDAVFSSDLTRAVQTAEIITLEKKLKITTSSLIRERNHWQYLYTMKKQGKSMVELENELRKTLSKLNDKAKMEFKIANEVESPAESVSRLLTFLREVAAAYLGKTVLVINHGSNMRSLLTHLGWAKFDELPFIKSIENTAYIVLDSDGVDFFISETHGIYKSKYEQRVF